MPLIPIRHHHTKSRQENTGFRAREKNIKRKRINPKSIISLLIIQPLTHSKMDTNRKDDYNTEAEPLLDLYDIYHASSSSSHDQQQTLPPGYYVDMTDIDSTTKDAHHSTSPAAVVAPVHPQCKYFSIPQFFDFFLQRALSLVFTAMTNKNLLIHPLFHLSNI